MHPRRFFIFLGWFLQRQYLDMDNMSKKKETYAPNNRGLDTLENNALLKSRLIVVAMNVRWYISLKCGMKY